MSRNYQLYIQDMESSCQKILRYTKSMDYDRFFGEELVCDAVMRNLQILGEAAKKIPEDVRLFYPKVEWKKITGFRDVLVHSYFGIDNSILWDIVQNKIPQLLDALSK